MSIPLYSKARRACLLYLLSVVTIHCCAISTGPPCPLSTAGHWAKSLSCRQLLYFTGPPTCTSCGVFWKKASLLTQGNTLALQTYTHLFWGSVSQSIHLPEWNSNSNTLYSLDHHGNKNLLLKITTPTLTDLKQQLLIFAHESMSWMALLNPTWMGWLWPDSLLICGQLEDQLGSGWSRMLSAGMAGCPLCGPWPSSSSLGLFMPWWHGSRSKRGQCCQGSWSLCLEEAWRHHETFIKWTVGESKSWGHLGVKSWGNRPFPLVGETAESHGRGVVSFHLKHQDLIPVPFFAPGSPHLGTKAADYTIPGDRIHIVITL